MPKRVRHDVVIVVREEMTFIGKSIEKSNTEQKISLYSKALELDANDINAMKGLAFCYKDLGKIELAIKYFSMAKKKTPFDRVLYYELGSLEFFKKNYIGAIKLFMKAIKLSPGYVEAIIAMAEAHEEIEEFDMAEMIYLKILEKMPYNLQVYDKMGHLYIKTGDYKKALNCFRDILALDISSTSAYFGMAKCFDEAGKEAEARRYYKKYLSLEPNSVHKNFVISQLEKMRMPKKYTNTDRSHLRVI